MFLELFALCKLINDITDHHVICDFSGHVDAISIQVFEGGWAKDKAPSFSTSLYENEDGKDIKRRLCSFLTDR